jgi:hypothetical protein
VREKNQERKNQKPDTVNALMGFAVLGSQSSYQFTVRQPTIVSVPDAGLGFVGGWHW